MPGISDPIKEARRVEAVRAALYRDKRWLKGAFFGNVSPEGLRRRGQNSRTNGTESVAFKLALLYINAVIGALDN
jgi:hypothetical protein